MRAALLAAAALTLASCSGGPTSTPASSAAAGATPAASATPAAAPAPAGAAAEAEFWRVALEAPASFRPGEPTAATVRIAARGGYHVNLDYPAAFVPAADATADFPAPRVKLDAPEKTACEGHPADTCALAARVPLTPRAGGDLRVAGTLHFSVCTAERCLIEKAPLAVTRAAPK
jgi:hypothetical protein